MNKGKDFRVGVRVDCLSDFLGVNRISPPVLHHDRSAATPLYVFFHPPTEDTVLADDRLVTRLEKIDECRLHSCRSRRRERNSQIVLGLEGELQ